MQVIQFNCNHFQVAQDIAIHYMMESSIRVALLFEPYRIYGFGEWAASHDQKSAVLCIPSVNSRIEWQLIQRGESFVIVKINDIVFISCYISPNIDYREYLYKIYELEYVICKHNNFKLVVAGDFNSRSTEWGDRIDTSRGDRLTEVVFDLSLYLCNKPGTPTCVRHQGNSVIVLTFCNKKICEFIAD